MSELSRQARRAMRAKIHRITKGESGKVDASDYGPEEVLNAGVKTGMRPISRRAFKKGGKVVANEGKDAVKHAGKKARSKPKHLTVDALVNRNVKDANEDREGIKHIGGLKTGGRATKNSGGPLDAMGGDLYGMKNVPAASRAAKAAGLKKGGRTERWLGGANTSKTKPTPTAPSTPSASTMPRTEEVDSMGRKELEALGRSAAEDAKKPIVPGRRKSGGRTHMDVAEDRALIGKMVKKSALTGKKHGGMAMDGEYQGTRPTGGRLAKKDGGSLAGLEMNRGGRTLFDVDNGSTKVRNLGADYERAGSHGEHQIWRSKSNPKQHVVVRGDNTVHSMFDGSTDQVKRAMRDFGPENLEYKEGDDSRTTRMPRKSGGRAKGKTNINIVISTGKGQPQDQMAPPMSQRPGGIPVAVPPQGAGGPPPMPAAPPPMPMPPAGGLGGAGPMGAAPMPRKRGGRTYRSYKDMDAGAGSGLGRLEKTEIAKHKK